MGMRDFQERKMIEHLFFSLPVLVLILSLIVLALWGTGKSWQIKRSLDKDVAELENEIAKVLQSRLEFERKSKELGSPVGLEKEARERFNLKKPGERVVVFLDDENADPVSDGRANWKASLLKIFKKLWPF